MSLHTMETKKKISKRDCIKLKHFCAWKESNKMKRQPTLWENIFTNDVSDILPHHRLHRCGVLSVIMFLCLLPYFMWSFYPSLCIMFTHSPQFFLKMNYSVCGCRFGVKVGGGRLKNSTLPSSQKSPITHFHIIKMVCKLWIH